MSKTRASCEKARASVISRAAGLGLVALFALSAAMLHAKAAADPDRVATDTRKPTRAAASSIKLSEVAGRYSILREGNKDTGCMLTLDDHTRKAILAPACRDQGVVIFDPAGWEIVAGRLVLTARKGHTTHLDHQEDGTWTKDPQEGKLLILKKQ